MERIEKDIKYHEDILALNLSVPCPCSDSKNVERESFRFMEKPYTAERNDWPQIVVSQKAGNGGNQYLNRPDDAKCTAYGLSMYETMKQAIDAFETLRKSKTLPKRYTSIASIFLQKEDGLADPTRERDGHFNYYPYLDTVLQGRYTEKYSI